MCPFLGSVEKKPTASVAFYQVYWEISSAMGKKLETFHREKEKMASFT